jgi:hypothetical protein
MGNQPDKEHEYGLALETAKPEVARPPLYQVLLLNDDYTPMDPCSAKISKVQHRPLLPRRPARKRHEFMTVEHLLLALLENPSAARGAACLWRSTSRPSGKPTTCVSIIARACRCCRRRR